MPSPPRTSAFGDAVHTVALARLRRRSTHPGWWLVLVLVLAAAGAAVWALTS